jgi:hypothetical protein
LPPLEGGYHFGMTKTAPFAALALFVATVGGTPLGAQTAAPTPAAASSPASQSSSEKLRENPKAQYLLVKTVVGQSIGVVDARARAIEPAGYNLLKYCWTAENVMGDWAERAGLAGEMVTRALEARSWQRDLVRAGYTEAVVAEAIGKYEAMLLESGFAEAGRARAVERLVGELDALRRATPGATEVRAVERCERERRSLGLNVVTVPEGGRARFMPYVLHQLCHAQQLDADDPVRCDYWMNGKADGPTGFAGETVYSVRWSDGTTANGRFDPEQSRATNNTVTLRLRLPKTK